MLPNLQFLLNFTVKFLASITLHEFLYSSQNGKMLIVNNKFKFLKSFFSTSKSNVLKYSLNSFKNEEPKYFDFPNFLSTYGTVGADVQVSYARHVPKSFEDSLF